MEKMKPVEQLELFEVKDNRIPTLREMFKSNIRLDPYWRPSVKELEKMEKSWKINGSKILEVYREEIKEYISRFEDEIEPDEED